MDPTAPGSGEFDQDRKLAKIRSHRKVGHTSHSCNSGGDVVEYTMGLRSPEGEAHSDEGSDTHQAQTV